MIDPYKHVSKVYAEIMGFISYKWWAKYLLVLTKKHLKKNPKVLELGAGNCTLAKYLSKNFEDYIVTDISLSMLKSSDIKNIKVCCDMTALPFKSTFDLIFASFDTINYITNKTKLLHFFSDIANKLENEGIFTFDAALENNSYKHQKTASTKGKTKEYKFVRSSTYFPKSRIHKNVFKITYPDGNVFTEIHKQKIFQFETFFETAEKSGLYIVNCYKAFTFQKGKAESDRVQFLMKRKKDVIN